MIQSQNDARRAAVRADVEERFGIRFNRDRERDLDLFLGSHSEPAKALPSAELLNGETYFFRYPFYLRVLTTELRKKPGAPFRVLSAACSSGEEAYSISMALTDVAAELGREIEIVGVDARSSAIQRARQATYGVWSLRGLSEERLQEFFEPVASEQRVAHRFRTNVSFSVHNLLEPLPSPKSGGLFDAIFLCNATLYMRPAAAGQVYAHVARALQSGGLLFTAPTDPPPGPETFHRVEGLAGWAVYSAGVPHPAPQTPAVPPPPVPVDRPALTPIERRKTTGIRRRAVLHRTPVAPGEPQKPDIQRNDALWNAWASGQLVDASTEIKRRLFFEPDQPLWRFLSGAVLKEQGWLKKAHQEFDAAEKNLARFAPHDMVEGLCTAAELKELLRFHRGAA